MHIAKFVLKAVVVPTALMAVGLVAAPAASAQISIGVNIGSAPHCPYGYYDYAPYQCSPYGYYGPEWFNGGVFIGAGQWFHGPAGFHGNVNQSMDPRSGYHGSFPAHGSYKQPKDNFKSFQGNAQHDGHAYVAKPAGGDNHGGGHDEGHK